jgi:uncharacterized membrane protein required for colicin V production
VSLTTLDWVALGVVALAAFSGLRRGLVASALSLAGLAAGGYAGSRIGPHLLHGGASSTWTPLAGLLGAIGGALILQTVAGILGSFLRGGLRVTPLRVLDAVGGLVLGAATGLALVWVLAAVAVYVPDQTGLRRAVQRSSLVRRLNDAVPPHRLFHLLARIDPFPSIAGPAAPSAPPSASVSRNPAVRSASAGVVRVLGTACGIGVEGTGWFATRHLVVTAAHVVAGERDTAVQVPGLRGLHRATAVAFDVHNDVAVLQVGGVRGHALSLVEPRDGAAVAIVGYPLNGPLKATPGRIGRTAVVLTQDAYGNGPVARTITAISGRIRHGNSGGPAVDASGAVEATIFAAKVGAVSGYGVPAAEVRTALGRPRRPVSTGSCAG